MLSWKTLIELMLPLVLIASLMLQIKAEPVPCKYTSLECKSINSTSEEFETNCCLYGEAESKKSCYILCKRNVKSGQCRGYCGNYLKACPPTDPSKPQKTTPAQNCDDGCGEQKRNNSSPTPSESQKTTPAQNCDDNRDQQMSKEKIRYQAGGVSIFWPYKIILSISLIGNFLSLAYIVLMCCLPSCARSRCGSIIRSCFCCPNGKSRRSTNNRTPPSSKTASGYTASYNHGAVRILRDAEEDDNADSDCEMLPNKSADLQSLDSKA